MKTTGKYYTKSQIIGAWIGYAFAMIMFISMDIFIYISHTIDTDMPFAIVAIFCPLLSLLIIGITFWQIRCAITGNWDSLVEK
jgi:hypothetical protein